MIKPIPPNVVNIQPDVGVFSILPHVKYRPWYALAEFVDNALDSFLKHESELGQANNYAKLRVEITIDPSDGDGGSITIRDNAAGIHGDEYKRAFRLAEPPINSSGLSEFGMGMKSAACWFGDKFHVRSSALGEELERTVTFNVKEIVRDKLSVLPIRSTSAPIDRHFTEIVISQLRPSVPRGRTITKIREHLASIYREFIRDGILELHFCSPGIDGVLSYEDPEILSAPPDERLVRKHKLPAELMIWRKDIDFDLGDGMRVKGFAALRKKANTSMAGFALFRRKRLIEGSGEDSYRPQEIFGASTTAPYQRLFGELHLEGFEVSHTKDGFQWDENEEPFLELLKEHLNKPPLPLIDQARDALYNTFQNKKAIADISEVVDEAVKNTGELLEGTAAPVLDEQIRTEPSEQLPPPILPQVQDSWKEEFELELHSNNWKVIVEVTNNPEVGNWITVSDTNGDTRKLGVSLSLAHPFMERFVGADPDRIKPFVRLAAAIGLAEITAREAGVKNVGDVRRNINQLLRDVLSQS